MNTVKILIEVRGGIVTDVISDQTVEVLILDYDYDNDEATGADELITVNDELCSALLFDATQDGARLESRFDVARRGIGVQS